MEGFCGFQVPLTDMILCFSASLVILTVVLMCHGLVCLAVSLGSKVTDSRRMKKLPWKVFYGNVIGYMLALHFFCPLLEVNVYL